MTRLADVHQAIRPDVDLPGVLMTSNDPWSGRNLYRPNAFHAGSYHQWLMVDRALGGSRLDDCQKEGILTCPKIGSSRLFSSRYSDPSSTVCRRLKISSTCSRSVLRLSLSVAKTIFKALSGLLWSILFAEHPDPSM